MVPGGVEPAVSDLRGLRLTASRWNRAESFQGESNPYSGFEGPVSSPLDDGSVISLRGRYSATSSLTGRRALNTSRDGADTGNRTQNSSLPWMHVPVNTMSACAFELTCTQGSVVEDDHLPRAEALPCGCHLPGRNGRAALAHLVLLQTEYR